MLCLSTTLLAESMLRLVGWEGTEDEEQQHRHYFLSFSLSTSMFIQCVRACLFHHHQSPPACRTSMCERLSQISFLLVRCQLTRLSFPVLRLSPPMNMRRKMRTIDKQVLLNQIIYYPYFFFFHYLQQRNSSFFSSRSLSFSSILSVSRSMWIYN